MFQWPEKKHNQHHVWQQYLRAWSTDGSLYCLMGNRIFHTGTSRLAVEKHFYKIGNLTSHDIALIRLLVIDVKGVHPPLRELHEGFLSLITYPLSFQGQSAELDKIIETYRVNVLEDHHASIEESFLPLLERALNGDVSFYHDAPSCIDLCRYLATQHMRTKGIKVKTIGILKAKSGIDVSRIWDVMSHMLATNIAGSLFLERQNRKFTLVENKTNRPFIAGDQPIINLHGDGKSSPTTLSWYYPISPSLALLLPEVDEEPAFTSDTLTEATVEHMNARIVAASHSQVFASSRAALEPYVHETA